MCSTKGCPFHNAREYDPENGFHSHLNGDLVSSGLETVVSKHEGALSYFQIVGSRVWRAKRACHPSFNFIYTPY